VTETEDVGSDTEYWKARLRDPSGAIYAYAGEYQPDAMAAIKDLDVPEHVAVTAKLSTFETDEGDTLVSLRPESIEVVGETERSRWIEETARFTLDRIEAFDDLSNDNEYAERAADSYGDLTDDILDDTIDILRECNWTAAADSVDDEDGDED
jgi:RPA family protein